MRHFRIKGSTYTVSASCLLDAIRKLVCKDEELAGYERHWYTRVNRLSWAKVRTTYGYECIVEEVKRDEGYGKEGGTIVEVERFVSAGGRRYHYNVYYATTGTRRDYNEHYGRRVTYNENDNLPTTVVEFLTADDTNCETTYTNTGRFEVYTKKEA